MLISFYPRLLLGQVWSTAWVPWIGSLSECLYLSIRACYWDRSGVRRGFLGLDRLVNAPRGNGNYVPGPRPYSAMLAIALGCFLPGFLLALTGTRSWAGCAGVVLMGTIPFLWWCDIVEESTIGGHHTFAITQTLKFGFILFILSEIMLFFSFFWS